MAGFQTCTVIGNCGADPELRHTQASQAVATFRVAVNETWVDKEGTKQERVEWFRIVAWGKLGEVCAEYLKKGRLVHVTGKLRTREYDDKDGVKRFSTELNADTVTFLGGGDGASSGERKPSTGSKPASGGYQRREETSAPPPMSDDDIPF